LTCAVYRLPIAIWAKIGVELIQAGVPKEHPV